MESSNEDGEENGEEDIDYTLTKKCPNKKMRED